MEEPKRVQFTTIGPNQKDQKKESPRKTVRFNLDLPATTDTACPEFSYSELLKNVSGDERPSDDPFGDDDDADKLAAIAKSFEEKYKPKVGKKKINREFLEDLVDIGDGYDETDTFIDNSEAYDEIVPATLTTKLGGFYVNSGKLELREISDDSDTDFQAQTGSGVKKKPKKRRILSDDESGQENKKIMKKKKVKDSLAIDGEVKKKKKKKIVLPDGEKPAKKPNLTQDKVKSNKSSSVSALLKSTSPQQNGENLQNGMLSPIELDDSDDSISKVTDGETAGKEDSNSQAEFDDSKKEIDPEKIPKLPPNLPAELEKTIESLKNTAKETSEGKCKFFTGNVNKLLLDVELASLQMSCGNRSAIYAHLAAYLPCSKDTLLKRAKTLRVKEMDDKIKGPLQKLKDAVNKAMPEQQEKYVAEFKAAQEKVAQEKASQEKLEETKESPTDKEKTRDSDNEEGKTNHSDATKKKFVGPAKRFVWDTNIRSLLCDVVKVKMESYEMSKARAQTAEEYLRTFLEKEVRPIWPKGWMQLRILMKESKPAHNKWTIGQKPKKNVLVSKTPGSAPTISHVTKTTNQGSAPASVTGSKIVMNNSNKNTPVVSESARSVLHGSAGNTPVVTVKKITPTILDYINDGEGKSSANNVPNSASVANTNVNNDNKGKPAAAAPNSGPAGKTSNPKTSPSQPLAESWNHQVADILRQSVVSQLASKPVTQAQFQRQNSAENSYLAQFQNFTASVYQHSANKLSSPKEPGQSQMSGQHQKTVQAKQAIDLSPPKAHSQSHMTSTQQQKFLKETQERNIQRLLEQQMEEKKKVAAAQQLAKMLNQAAKSGPPSSVNASLVKNLGHGHGSGDSVSKSLPMKQTGKNVSALTENVIRQHLDKQATSVSSSNKSTVQGHSVANVNTSPSGLADPLRKTSPQSAVLSSGMSQVKPQVIRMTNVQGQGHSDFTSSNALSATSLMQSLFGQAQSKINQSKSFSGISTTNSNLTSPFQSGTSHNASNQSRSHQQHTGGASQMPQVLAANWNTGSTSLPGFNGTMDKKHRTSFDGSGDGSSSQFLGASGNPHPAAGYQNVKLSTLTGEQMAAFQHHTGMPGQPHRSPETGRYGSQMAPHTSPGSYPSHSSPHKQRSSLNYGYPYTDSR